MCVYIFLGGLTTEYYNCGFGLGIWANYGSFWMNTKLTLIWIFWNMSISIIIKGDLPNTHLR